jgi:protein-S-isoprenylcysteine O-methyltransferase Ste14
VRIITENKKLSRKKKRILVLIGSGIYVIIIMPIIGILVSMAMDNLLNLPKIIPPPYNLVVAPIFLIVGFFWSIWANIEIYKRGKGSPVPFKDTHTLNVVSSGPYKYTRNPMIFGYVLIWIGLGVLINSFFLTVGFALIILIVLIVIVKVWEEKNLEKRFGSHYLEYKKNVSFIIPFLKKAK